MAGIFELPFILAGAGITGSTFWVWRYKNWSTQKKAAIALLLIIGLIAAAFASSLAFWVREADNGIGIKEVSKSPGKSGYAEITGAGLKEYNALKSITGFLSSRVI